MKSKKKKIRVPKVGKKFLDLKIALENFYNLRDSRSHKPLKVYFVRMTDDIFSQLRPSDFISNVMCHQVE